MGNERASMQHLAWRSSRPDSQTKHRSLWAYPRAARGRSAGSGSTKNKNKEAVRAGGGEGSIAMNRTRWKRNEIELVRHALALVVVERVRTPFPSQPG